MDIQGSDAWFEARRGRATASCFADVLAKGQGITRKKYMLKIVTERLTGKVAESFSNAHTDRGTEQEPFARMAYEFTTGNIVEEVGFVPHSSIMAGCSPDGLIGTDGGCEIKSVLPHIQIETIQAGGYPSGHRAQVQGCLWLTGREWFDFCSYSPDLPDNLSLYVYRVERDEDYIKALELEVGIFLLEVDQMYQKLLNWGK
jgi:hypothetical protein